MSLTREERARNALQHLKEQDAYRKEHELDDAIDNLAEALKRLFLAFEERIMSREVGGDS